MCRLHCVLWLGYCGHHGQTGKLLEGHGDRQLRAIARSPVHITRESNEVLQRRLKVKDPILAQYDQACHHLEKARSSQYKLQDFVMEDIVWLEKVQLTFVAQFVPDSATTRQVRLRKLPVRTKAYTRPVCEQRFPNKHCHARCPHNTCTCWIGQVTAQILIKQGMDVR